MKTILRDEQGSALLGVLILTTLAGLILASVLNASSTHLNTTREQKVRTVRYYTSESAIHLAVNWLRENSHEFVEIAKRETMYSYFDPADPGTGTNDQTTLKVPSNLRVNSTGETAILSNDNSIAYSNFPDGTTKNLMDDFKSLDTGDAKVRITLLNLLPDKPAKDYGDTDLGNPEPETNFYPIFKIDAVTEVDQGMHVHAFVETELVQNKGVGFYGEDFVTMNQGCDSFDSSEGSYSSNSKKANCGVGSGGSIELHQNEIVYGSLSTKGSVATSSPYGGEVCADFENSCPNKGDACEGTACELPALPLYDPWNTSCPTDQGNVTVNSNQTFTVLNNSPSQKCWDTVDVKSNKTLTFITTAYPYYIRTFDIANNSTLMVQPDDPNGTIHLYVEKFTGDKFNGNQMFNMNNTASNFEIHYLGTDELVLNGNADMKAFITAPNANIKVQGNFDFYGGIFAKSLNFTGNGKLHYDEAGRPDKLVNMRFKVKNIVQEYKLL